MSFPDPALMPASGALERVAPRIRRLVAPNASPLTASGTCTYIVGEGEVAVIDPGPDDARHLRNLLAATEGERVGAVLVTHSHADHVGLAAKFARACGAPVLGGGPPHVRGRGGAYTPDRALGDGEAFKVGGHVFTALATPGHAPDHLCFAYEGADSLFSGDHVMAWSTTVVAPPDGVMGRYFASLERLRGRPEALYWPGHGGAVVEPQRYVGGLIKHRRQREAAVLARLREGDDTLEMIAERVYPDIAPALRIAARLSTLAHLEHLAERGLARVEGDLREGGRVVAV